MLEASRNMNDSSLAGCLALHRAGRFAEAERGYRRLLVEGIDAALPLSALLLQQARNVEAIELLSPLCAAHPDKVSAAVNLSIALRNVGRCEEALQAATRAYLAAPGDFSACNARGLAALELGDAPQALSAFEEGLRRAPGNIALELHRSKALRKLHRYRDAAAVLERIVKTAPDLLEAWRDLAAAQRALGLYGPALQSAARALKLAPNDLEVALEHAVALLKSGDTAKAIARLEKLNGDAQTWMWLAQARLRQNDVPGARAALERAAKLDPENAFIRHFLAAASGGVPQDIEVDYIRGLFDEFAERFESTLLDKLGYSAPKRIAHFLREHGAADAKDVLDLGCGTGLMGAELASAERRVDGVDLSERMLAQARAKGIYNELHAVELLDFLRDSTAQWDLLVAADVFIYVADLTPIFAAAFDRLRAGGHFAFSIECSDVRETQLLAQTGRYRHAPEMLATALERAGFCDIARESLTLRLESGVPVAGELMLARRP